MNNYPEDPAETLRRARERIYWEAQDNGGRYTDQHYSLMRDPVKMFEDQKLRDYYYKNDYWR